jgi:hypothetical protein
MAKGQQERISGVCQAMVDGADLVVMGSQMKKGNSGKGISVEESQRLTRIEIDNAINSGRSD